MKMSLTTKLLAASVIALGLLSACDTTPPKHMMDIQAGERFILTQPLNIAANSSRSYIQNGQILDSAGFNQFRPHCRLEVRSLSEQTTIIQPDDFKIVQVKIGVEAIAGNKRPQTGQQLALLAWSNMTMFSATAHAASDSDNDVGIEPTMDFVELYLSSSKQPDVFRLTCAGSLSDGDAFDAPHSYRPERQQINRILGDIGQIQH